MHTKLSAETMLADGLRDLNISVASIAALGNISQSTLSRVFRGVASLTGPDAVRLMGLLRDLRALAEACRPIPISFKNPQLIAPLLQEFRETEKVNVTSFEEGACV